MTYPRARGSEDSVSDRGRDRRRCRFAKADWGFRAREELDLDFRYSAHAEQPIRIEVCILRLAVHELRSLVQGHAQPPQCGAFNLGRCAVRMNYGPGINNEGQLLYCDVAAGAVHPYASAASDPGGHASFQAEGGRDAEPNIFRRRLTPSGHLRHAREYGRLPPGTAHRVR